MCSTENYAAGSETTGGKVYTFGSHCVLFGPIAPSNDMYLIIKIGTGQKGVSYDPLGEGHVKLVAILAPQSKVAFSRDRQLVVELGELTQQISYCRMYIVRPTKQQL